MEKYPNIVIEKSPESLKYKKLLLKEAGLCEFEDMSEVWDIPFSSKKLAYKTHSIFRFYGKFPPPIARYLIERYTDNNDLILDPMCGSGTSAVEALLMKRQIICADVSPISQLLVNVKCRYIKDKVLIDALREVNKKYNNKSRHIYDITRVPLEDSKIKHWFLPETYKNLLKLLNAIHSLQDEDVRETYLCILINIIRKTSKATSLQGRLFLDVDSAIKEPIDLFNKTAEKIIKSIETLPEDFEPPKFIMQDIRQLKLKSGKPKLIICHPPYFNVYKFSSIFSLELPWLMCDKKSIRQQELREFFKVGKKENVHRYVEDMAAGIKNISQQMKKNTFFALMIGDTRIRGEYIRTTKLLLDSIADCELTLISIAIRRPKFTEASWVASQRRTGSKVGINISDFILVFRKSI
ncbi:MAG: hypothetical protein HQ575_05230 [Candidatus Omnitrophica bacterium]|nr:hypothetical protein [Candidatus Omnitrophota bacterium]